jgi:hypothetical protein
MDFVMGYVRNLSPNAAPMFKTYLNRLFSSRSVEVMNPRSFAKTSGLQRLCLNWHSKKVACRSA